MLENTEGAIKKGQFRETGSIVYTRRKQAKKYITHYVLDTTAQTNTNNEIRHELS